MIDRTFRLPLLLAALAALTLFSALASPQAHAATCPDFTILHDDRIDGVSLPHGRYGVTVFSGVTCQDTTRLLQKFLQSGKTSDGWKINSKAVFTKGSQSWQIKKGGGGGGGGDGEGGGRNVCPAPFRVLHNDRIGDLQHPRGQLPDHRPADQLRRRDRPVPPLPPVPEWQPARQLEGPPAAGEVPQRGHRRELPDQAPR